jgi:signal transduction histidine kinase
MQGPQPEVRSPAEVIRVLLVEDDPEDVLLLRETLSDVPSVQFDVTHVGTLGEALPRLGEPGFEVVLLDLSLPDSQGFETFGTVKASGSEVPVVVLTGLDDETLALRAVQAGAQDYLVKGRADGELLCRSIRYAIERQRTSHYRALITERKRFDTAVSQMTDGIIVTGGDWRLTTANRAAHLLLNLQGDSWRDATLQQALAPFALSVPAEELWTSGDRVTAFEVRRLDAGPPLFVDARLTRLTDAGNNLVSAVLMLRDVTAERRAANVKADFLTLLSHKVRTPLTVLIGYLSLCKKLPRERLQDEWQDLITTCDSEAHRLSHLLQTLLDFKVTEALQSAAKEGTTDVGEVIHSRSEELRQRYSERAVEVASEVAPDAARAEADPAHVALVLDKILDNAAKFGDKDPTQIGISVARAEPGWLQFSVTDNGPGIPHEYLDRVFQEFVQVEDLATGRVPGLGVGLHMAKKVVEAHGGTISIRSHLGEGTTVTFSFPAG